MFKSLKLGAIFALFVGGASAATFTDQTLFENELDTFEALDTSSFIGSTTFTIPLATGSFFGPDALVRSDDLILNGAGFHGPVNSHVGINFTGSVNAAGVTSNAADGGRIQFYSGLNGSGSLLGEFGFGGGSTASFTGVIINTLAQSVIYTCDFNGDLKCGLRDPVFGYDASAVSAVPLPGAGMMLVGALGGFGLYRRRKVA